jgi:cysteine synthase A
VPGIIARHREAIDGFVDVHSDEAIVEMRRLASVHGLFVGPSSGAHMIAAKKLKKEYNVENVVTFFCDEGEKYISDYWL